MNSINYSMIKQRLINKKAEDVFIIDTMKNRRYTYKLFYQYVEAYIKILEEYHIPNTIFISMNNSFNLVVLYFACIAMGKTVSPIDPNKNADEVAELVKAIPDSILVADSHNFNMSEINILSADIFFSTNENNFILPDVEIELFLSKFENINIERPCLITYTSGTSGRQKGVIHNLGNLILSAEVFIKHLNIDEKNAFYHAMPMTYMAGILNTIILPFIAGASIILAERFSIAEAASFWKKVEESEANTFWFSPSMLAMLDKTDKHGGGRVFCDLHKTLWLIGTAPLSLNLKKEFEEKYNVKLFQSYGLSETLFVTAVNDESYTTEDSGVGTVLDGAEINWRGDGELLISVPWMFLGYTNESTEEYFDGNCYISGDIGELSDGKLYITDRKKDLIIRGGINISPKAIETIARGIKSLADAVVFKGHAPMMGETVVCAVVAKAGYNPEEIKKELLVSVRKLGTGYAIDKIIFLDEMPLNLNGKIDKRALENLDDH